MPAQELEAVLQLHMGRQKGLQEWENRMIQRAGNKPSAEVLQYLVLSRYLSGV